MRFEPDDEVWSILRRIGPAVLSLGVGSVFLFQMWSNSSREYGTPFGVMVGIVMVSVLFGLGRAVWNSVRKARDGSRPVSRVKSTTQFEWDNEHNEFN